MPKFLIEGAMTAEGAKGVLKDGGSKRRAVIEEFFKSVGGKLEAFYYAFGETDVLVIVDLPDNVSAAAVTLAMNAGGVGRDKTTVLITPEEMDAATKKTVSYSPPGR